MPTGILSLKLGKCVNMPSKRADKLLHHIGAECNRVRNKMVRVFVRWHEDHPAYEPQVYTTKSGKQVTESATFPLALVSSKCDTGFYRQGQATSNMPAAKIISAIQAEVVDYLNGNMPYNHGGLSRWRWQGILNCEINAPSYRSLAIPVQKQDTCLVYDGTVYGQGISAERAASACMIRLALLSKASGYAQRGLIYNLEVGRMSGGNRRLLKRIVSGDLPFCDSRLVCKNGEWFVRLCYNVPEVDHGLDADRVATLRIGGKLSDMPLCVHLPDEDRPRRIGDGKPLVAEYERLTIRRKSLQYRYRSGRGSGHGQERVYRAIRPLSRRMADVKDSFDKYAVACVIHTLVRDGTGTLVYREPTMPLRDHAWFAQHGIPMDWTRFVEKLKFACAKHRIALSVERMGVKEHKETWPREWPENKEREHVASDAAQEAVRTAVPAVSGNGNGHAQPVPAAGKNGVAPRVPRQRLPPLRER